jgi:hypothetical protein
VHEATLAQRERSAIQGQHVPLNEEGAKEEGREQEAEVQDLTSVLQHRARWRKQTHGFPLGLMRNKPDKGLQGAILQIAFVRHGNRSGSRKPGMDHVETGSTSAGKVQVRRPENFRRNWAEQPGPVAVERQARRWRRSADHIGKAFPRFEGYRRPLTQADVQCSISSKRGGKRQ